MKLRVATWNIHEAFVSHSDSRFEPWKHVHELDLDVLALQETPFNTDAESRIVSDLKKHTHLQFSQAYPIHPSSYGHHKSGLALLTKYPISDNNIHYFGSNRYKLRIDGQLEDVHEKGVSHSVCHTPIGNVALFNLHLFPFHRMGIDASNEQFRAVWDELRNLLASEANAAAVALGDFNTPDRDLLIRPGLAYSRVVGDRVTHEGFASDDILISSEIRIRKTDLLKNPSDHLLCFAELEISAEKSEG